MQLAANPHMTGGIAGNANGKDSNYIEQLMRLFRGKSDNYGNPLAQQQNKQPLRGQSGQAPTQTPNDATYETSSNPLKQSGAQAYKPSFGAKLLAVALGNKNQSAGDLLKGRRDSFMNRQAGQAYATGDQDAIKAAQGAAYQSGALKIGDSVGKRLDALQGAQREKLARDSQFASDMTADLLNAPAAEREGLFDEYLQSAQSQGIDPKSIERYRGVLSNDKSLERIRDRGLTVTQRLQQGRDQLARDKFDYEQETDEREYSRDLFESDRDYDRSVIESDRDYRSGRETQAAAVERQRLELAARNARTDVDRNRLILDIEKANEERSYSGLPPIQIPNFGGNSQQGQPVPRATNPQTGETIELRNGQWVAVSG